MMKPPSLSSEKPPEFPPPRPRNPRNKKSREFPSFSDCNCCNCRINCKKTKNRFEILKSEWRIVILCKNCYNLVEKSEICSYCLIRVSSEFYDCVKCRRRIHKDCAENFSYDFCDDFSVCFDCWIPNLLENEFNRSRKKIRKKRLGKNHVDRKSVSSSGLRVLLEKENCLKDVVKEAEKKIIVAVEAKENAFRKIMAARKAVEYASGAVAIVAIDEGGDNDDDVEDGKLAMNSLSRVSRNECLLNSHCVDVPRVENDCALKLYGKKPSQVVACKEEIDCALKLYSRKPSQASELEAAQCLPQLVNLEAGKSLKYSRRRLYCKSMLNRENGNRGTEMLLTCLEEPMSLANAT